MTGYPAGWSVAAALAAITAHIPALLPLLGDFDPTVRVALANGYAGQRDAMVRAALLLATAEITRADPHPPIVTWLSERWQDQEEVPEARLAAAIGWLCLTDDPASEELRRTVDALSDDERAHTMEALPWMSAAAGSNEPGLLPCKRCMLHPEEPDPIFWGSLF